MRIGIVTFHRAHNYGAVLQCFALKAKLSSMGHALTVIDHRNNNLEKRYDLFPSQNWKCNPILSVKNTVSRLLTYRLRKERRKSFDCFIKKYLLNNCSYDNIWDGFDCIVWGSDQIWQWNIIKDDKCFWGDIPNKSVRKITYAASSGKIDKHFEERITSLSNYNAISVRENDLKNYLLDKNIKTEVVVDPSLLLTKEEWDSYLPLTRINKKPYILVYAMRDSEKTLKMANNLSRKLGLEIVELHNFNISPLNLFPSYYTNGPIDFVSLFKYADFVVTDSFHGTAFSIIFQRQFITLYLNDGHDNRAHSLLHSLHLQSRHLTIDNPITNLSAIDYNCVETLLKPIRENSIQFLTDSISE